MKRFVLSLTVALTAVMMLAASASACDKHGKKNCPVKSGKAKWMLTEIEGKGMLATLVFKGTDEENAKWLEKYFDKITKCTTGGDCKCKDKHPHHCPYTVEGVKYDVKKVDGKLEVTVTGDDKEALDNFKALMEAKISGKFKGHHGHKGCKGDGSCGCKKAEAGECPHKKKGTCGCGKAEGGECPHKKEGKCKGDGSCGCGK